jgi:hypothetical protein
LYRQEEGKTGVGDASLPLQVSKSVLERESVVLHKVGEDDSGWPADASAAMYENADVRCPGLLNKGKAKPKGSSDVLIHSVPQRYIQSNALLLHFGQDSITLSGHAKDVPDVVIWQKFRVEDVLSTSQEKKWGHNFADGNHRRSLRT